MEMVETGVIYVGEAKLIMKRFPNKCVDCVYIDPPFDTSRNHGILWGDRGEEVVFKDRHKGGVEHYMFLMEPILRECHRVLKDTGSFYLHCDYRANAEFRKLLNKIFGRKNFQNEIIWHYGLGGSSPKRWARKHDTIFFYSKGKEWNFDPVMIPATSQRMKGELKKSDDVWDIPSINNMSKERLGYPTQKPESLLELIIEASSNEGDIILDPMAGGGTTPAVAQRLKRRWIAIDASEVACVMYMKPRLGNVKVINTSPSISYLKTLTSGEFEDWVAEWLDGYPNLKKVDDGGVDGHDGYNIPIQSKQQENVGPGIVSRFRTDAEEDGRKSGILVAFSFTKKAINKEAWINNNTDFNMSLRTVEELLNTSTTPGPRKESKALNWHKRSTLDYFR